MKRQGNDNSVIDHKIGVLCFLAMLFIVFLTVGFSSFSANLNLSSLGAYVMAQADIRVTNVSIYDTSSNGVSNWERFNVNNITSYVSLPNSDSTVTFRIEVTNIGNTLEGIYAIGETYKIANTNNNSPLEIKSQTVNTKEALCDDTISNKCTLGSVTTFNITIGYASGGYNGTDIDHSIKLDFDFRRVFEITYIGFTNTTGLPTQMINGDTKVITFTSTTSIPSDVLVSGATGNYVSPNLTLSNITVSNLNETIEVTKIYPVTYTGFTGSTSSLPSYMLPSGGSITFTSTSGIPVSVSVTGATGSYTSPTLAITNVTGDITVSGSFSAYTVITDNTTTTYDHTTLTPNTDTTFTNIAGKPRVVVDGDGKVISFEYTDCGSGISFAEGDSFDTGVDAFDSGGYTIHLKYKMDPYDNTGRMVISAMKKTNGNKYAGFSFNVYSGTRFYLYANTSGANINNTAFGTLLGTFNVSSGEQTYEFDMTYTPEPNKGISITLTPCTSGSPYTATSNNLSYYPDTLEDASIVLGGSVANHNKDIETMTILEFSVTKD